MSLIPPENVTQSDLAQWYEMKKQQSALKASEMLLRMKIFKFFFPNPQEGANKAFDDDRLGNGFKLSATYPIDRKVDEGIFEAMKDKLKEAGIQPQSIVKYKPELELKQYRALTDEQRHLVDQFLQIKPGSPQMEIKPKSSRD